MKKLLATLLLLLPFLVPQAAFAAISFDSSNTNAGFTCQSGTNAVTNITNSNSNTFIEIGILDGSSADTATVQVNGVSATLINSAVDTGEKTLMFGIMATTTSEVVAVSCSLGSNSVNISEASYNGVAAVPTNSAGANGTAGSFSTSLITNTANAWVIMWARNQIGTFTAGTNTTIDNQHAGFGMFLAHNTNAPVVTPATVTMAASWSSSVPWGNVMAELDPFGAAPPSTPLINFVHFFGWW